MGGAGSTAAKMGDFTTAFNTLVGTNLDDNNVAAKVALMRAMLAEAEPTDDDNAKAAWKAYHALDASDKAAVKESIVFKYFVDGFATVWDAAYATSAVNNFATVLRLASGTMGKATPRDTVPLGEKTNKYWVAMNKPEEREALQRYMLTGSNAVGTKLTSL